MAGTLEGWGKPWPFVFSGSPLCLHEMATWARAKLPRGNSVHKIASALAVAGPLARPGGVGGDGGCQAGASSVLVDQLVGSKLRTAAIRV